MCLCFFVRDRTHVVAPHQAPVGCVATGHVTGRRGRVLNITSLGVFVWYLNVSELNSGPDRFDARTSRLMLIGWNPDIEWIRTRIFRTSENESLYDEIAASSWLSYRLSLWASLIKWLILRLSDPEEITSAQTLE